jgi:hypothetical protein
MWYNFDEVILEADIIQLKEVHALIKRERKRQKFVLEVIR